MHELVKGTNPNYVLGDRSYGKSGVRILHVVREGKNKKAECEWKKQNLKKQILFRHRSSRQGARSVHEVDFGNREGLFARRQLRHHCHGLAEEHGLCAGQEVRYKVAGGFFHLAVRSLLVQIQARDESCDRNRGDVVESHLVWRGQSPNVPQSRFCSYADLQPRYISHLDAKR